MENVIDLLKRKGRLMYIMNSLQDCITEKNYDERLKTIWDEYNAELEQINRDLDEIKTPTIEEYEAEKLRLIEKVNYHKEQLAMYQTRLDEIRRLILSMES